MHVCVLSVDAILRNFLVYKLLDQFANFSELQDFYRLRVFRFHNPPAVAFTIKSPCLFCQASDLSRPRGLAFCLGDAGYFFYFTRGGLIIQRASCIMVDVFRVFKEIKYIVCFTCDEILIIYRKIKITQILSALL